MAELEVVEADQNPSEEETLIAPDEDDATLYDKGCLALSDDATLYDKGCLALSDDDLLSAVDLLSRALEARVARYGELAPECSKYYFKYGCALLYKAQEEVDPLNESVALKKKDQVSKGDSSSSTQNPVHVHENSKGKELANSDDGKVDGEGEEEEDESSDGEDVEEAAEGEEEEDSDLELAWKMLEAARVILDKSEDTIEKADVISTLGDVSLEREDFETSISDYTRALIILEKLDESDSRHIAQLYFKISLALQMQNKFAEALSHCEKALTICRSRLQRLKSQHNSSGANTDKQIEAASGVGNEIGNAKDDVKQVDDDTSDAKQIGDATSNDKQIADASQKDKQNGDASEIPVLEGLMVDLTEKVEDLKQMLSEPSLPDLFKSAVAGKMSEGISCKASKNTVDETGFGVSNGFDQPKFSSTSAANITNLGIVGRGVKRAAPTAADLPEQPIKKVSVTDANVDTNHLKDNLAVSPSKAT